MSLSDLEPVGYALVLKEIEENEGIWSDTTKEMIDSLDSCEFLPFTIHGTNSDAVGFITADFKFNIEQEDFTSLINLLTALLNRNSLASATGEYIFNKNKIKLLLRGD